MTHAGFVELEKDEEIIALPKRVFFWPMRQVVFTVLLSLLPFVLLFPAWSFGVMGMSVYGALVIFVLWNAIRFYLARHFSMLIITNKRLIDIDQRGIIGREIIEIPLFAIESAEVLPQGFVEKRLGIGGVKICSSEEAEYDIIFTPVKFPERLREFIDDVKRLDENESVIYEANE